MDTYLGLRMAAIIDQNLADPEHKGFAWVQGELLFNTRTYSGKLNTSSWWHPFSQMANPIKRAYVNHWKKAMLGQWSL